MSLRAASILHYAPGVRLGVQRRLPKIGDEAFPGVQNFNTLITKFISEGGTVYACRLAPQALYGQGEPALIKKARSRRAFATPTIKADRKLTRDSSYVAEFVNTPIRLEDVAIELSDEETAMLDGLRKPVCGADDGAALRDILFTSWEQTFLGAAESGAPAIGDRKS